MERYKRSDIKHFDYIGSGTSAAFIGINKVTGKKGIYKENGCMAGFSNEDVREKLVSQILKEIGIDCAEIDLVYDEKTKENACFSNYIINEDEKLVEPKEDFKDINKYDEIEKYVEGYINGVKKITKDENFHDKCRQNLYNYMYIASILYLYDVKTDNLPIIQNVKTGEYRVCPWFDFGISLKEEAYQRKGPFSRMSTDEIINTLYKNHYDKIENISIKVSKTLSKEKIEELFSQEYVKEAFEQNELENIKNRVNSQIDKCSKLQNRKNISESKMQNNSKGWFCKLKQRIMGIKNIFSVNKSLPPAKNEKILNITENVINEFQSECKDLTKNTEEIIYDAEYNRVSDKEVVIDSKNEVIK